MSTVTNLILTFSITEDCISKENEINLFHNNGRGFILISADNKHKRKWWKSKDKNTKWYGGSKHLETNMYIGAYNHLDLKGFIEHLKEIDWLEPENVQLVIKEELDEKFRIIEIL